MMNLPDIKARAILIDAPLPFKTWSHKGEGRSPQHHYACMSIEELMALPITSMAAPDCFLFLWIPLRSVDLVKPLIEAWGFEFSGAGFCWAKQNKSGVGWFMGGGYGTRHNLEIAWLGPARQAAAEIRRRSRADRRTGAGTLA